MNDSLAQLVVLILVGLCLLALLVLVIKKWRLVLKLALFAAVVAGALIFLCRPLGLPFCRGGGGGGGPGAGPGAGGTQGGGGPPVAVQETGAGLQVINRSSEPLYIRVAWVVTLGGGYRGVCNPYGPAGNRSVPLPQDPRSPYDQPLGPFQAMTVPATACPGSSGYSVWARNTHLELIFEQHR